MNRKYRLLSTDKTGEPRSHLHMTLGRRIRSTSLLEREPAMVKRLQCKLHTDGKGSKWTDFNEDVPYLNSLQKLIRVTDGTKTAQRLHALWKLSERPNARGKHLWKLMDNTDLWIAAYKKLAANEGSMTPGGAKGTIDGTSLKGLKALKDMVISGRYKVGVTRRINIPKPKGGSRPLGIPEWRDRIIQEVIRILLECIYEPRFVDSSHGFRPKRSQHTCLRQIRRDFGASRWVIEGDISKCFDKIDHEVVMKCLNKTIDDSKFERFIHQGLKAKVFMPDGKMEFLNVGTPQGGVCSPLLSNIVLHQMDIYMRRLKKAVDKGVKRSRNPGYDKLINAATYGAKTKTLEHHEIRRLKRKARDIGRTYRNDPGFRRLNYVRFADDFLVGVTGPRALAERIKELLTAFLKRRLKLELNGDKTLISRIKNQAVKFLGYKIKRGPDYAMTHVRHYDKVTRRIRRLREGGLILLVDMDKVIAGLEYKGFCKKKTPTPNFRYLHQTQSYTVAAANSIIRGLAHYYKLSEGRRSSMNHISYIVRYSVAKMFAAKYKLGSVAKVFAKAGKDLGQPLKPIKHRPLGATDEQLAKDAHGAGRKLRGDFPALLYTRYKNIPQADLKPMAKNWNPWLGV
jgi:group II intron reverse transcriptase/maturase